MGFLRDRAIYYLSFLEALSRDTELDNNPNAVFSAVEELMMITEEESADIKAIFQNEIFQQIRSAYAADFYLNAVEEVCRGAGLFGEGEGERAAIEKRRDALHLPDHQLP